MMLAGAAVAGMTQAAAVAARSRKRHLRGALERLLTRLSLSPGDASTIAALTLRHPLAAGSLRRENLVRILLELAAAPSAESLHRAFGFAHASDAIRLLCAWDRRALELELSSPGEPLDLRQTRAVLAAAGPNPAIARIHSEFALAMQRATARYRAETRTLAAAAALAVVFALKLDSLELLARAARLQHARCPGAGLALSWMLLSLGAPFWYDRLKDLLHLRPEH